MPSTQRVLPADQAARIAADRGFVPPGDAPRGRAGIEMEWLTVALADPSRPADLAEVRKAAAGAESKQEMQFALAQIGVDQEHPGFRLGQGNREVSGG